MRICIGTCDDVASQKFLSELLIVFDEVLLPTHASRYVQFIVFYVSSLSKVAIVFLQFYCCVVIKKSHSISYQISLGKSLEANNPIKEIK